MVALLAWLIAIASHLADVAAMASFRGPTAHEVVSNGDNIEE